MAKIIKTETISGKVEKNGYSFYAVLTETALDDYLTTNKTTIDYSIYLQNGNVRTESGNWIFNAKIDDIDVYNESGKKVASNSVGFGKSYLLFSGSEEIEHDIDGSKKIKFSASIERSSYSSYDPGHCELEGTFELTKIKRASTWAFTSNQMSNIEDTLVLKMNKYVDSYTNKAVIENLSMDVTIKTIEKVEDGYEVTFTEEELEQIYTIGDNESLTNLRFYLSLYTYDGDGNQVGTVQRTLMNAYLTNANPTFTYTIEETEQKVIDLLESDTADYIVKAISKPKVTIKATALKGASIKTISIVNSTQANANENPYVFENVQTGTFTIVVTDSRDLTTTQVITRNLVNYTPVYINSYKFKRASQTSANILLTADVTCYSGSFNSITNIPTIMYKIGTNGEYVEIADGYTFENNKIIFVEHDLGEILPYTETNKIYLYVLDLLTEDTENEIVSKGIATFEAGEHDFQVNGDLFVADEKRENKVNVLETINSINSSLIKVRCGGISNITSTSKQTLYEGTISKKGVYLFFANVPINYYGQSGREIHTELYINNVSMDDTTGVINTYAFTVSRPVFFILNIESDNVPIKLSVYSTSTATYAVSPFVVTLLKLK